MRRFITEVLRSSIGFFAVVAFFSLVSYFNKTPMFESWIVLFAVSSAYCTFGAMIYFVCYLFGITTDD